MKKNSPSLINIIFSYLFIANAVLLLMWIPAYIFQAQHSRKEINSVLFVTIICVFYALFSYHAFYSGIDLPDLEGRPTRYGPMSAGDKEFFKFFSKPIAFGIQILYLILQSLILNTLYLS